MILHFVSELKAEEKSWQQSSWSEEKRSGILKEPSYGRERQQTFGKAEIQAHVSAAIAAAQRGQEPEKGSQLCSQQQPNSSSHRVEWADFERQLCQGEMDLKPKGKNKRALFKVFLQSGRDRG